MGWKFSRITTSLMGLLSESDADMKAQSRLEDIREAMLESMTEALEGRVVRPAVWGQVLYAQDIQMLWYLRSDLMAFLSDHYGETMAQQKMTDITREFRDLIPKARRAVGSKSGKSIASKSG
jgi:hypothetical protein